MLTSSYVIKSIGRFLNEFSFASLATMCIACQDVRNGILNPRNTRTEKDRYEKKQNTSCLT
jgi:hypothetical protein